MDFKKTLLTVKEYPLFSIAEETNLISAIEKFPPKDLKLSTGETCEIQNSIALVLSGKLDLIKNISDKNVYLKTVNAPCITGLATLFDKEREYISTISAKKEVEAILLSEKLIEHLILHDSKFALEFTKLLCTKVRYLNRRIDYYTCSSADKKVYEFLERSVINCDGEKSVEMSMSKLSEILGIGRASLYRALLSLEEEGKVIKNGKKIILIK
ncbi:MAG: Crp/Fnr family transcriptional regulator [Ruminococcaceae bacterium]|nr:Crp/Fnr family transcriptional regulator [Oscillospiraceae bacterium]